MAGKLAEPRDIIQRIDETQIGKFRILPGDRGIGRFDVQIGDVIRQDRDFIGVQFVLVFVRELFPLPSKML